MAKKLNQTGNTHKHNTHTYTGAQQVVNASTCAHSMLWSHIQTGSCRRPAASVWLWLSGVPFLISVSSHRCVFLLCVCMTACVHAAVATRRHPLRHPIPTQARPPSLLPPPRRISRHACWGPHHSQSCIHGKFNFSRHTGMICTLTQGSISSGELCLKLKKQAEDVFYNGAAPSKI